MTLIYNPAAFKHSLTELDIETAMATALIDELIEGFDNKYLIIGFDTNRNFIEVMYNGLVQQPILLNPGGFGLLNKSRKMLRILPIL